MAWKAIGMASLFGLIASNFVDNNNQVKGDANAQNDVVSKVSQKPDPIIPRRKSQQDPIIPHSRNLQDPIISRPGSMTDQPKTSLLLASISKSIVSDTAQQEKTIHKDTVNTTPLMYAAAKGDITKMKAYMHMVRKQDSREMTALMYAAYYGHLEAIKLLVWDEAKMHDKRGKTALMYAAQQGCIECVSILLPFEKGMVDKDNWNALMYSAMCNDMPCQELIDAESEYINEDSEYILKAGLLSKHNKIGHTKIQSADISLIEVNILGITPLMEAATVGDIQGVKAHIKEYRGRKDRYGTTALMYAAIGNHIECVRLLRTSERREQDHEGFTALMRAAIHGNIECIELLAADEYGILNNIRWSAIAYLIQNNHLEGLQYLLHLEGSLQEREDVGYSIISLLEQSPNPWVQTLLQSY